MNSLQKFIDSLNKKDKLKVLEIIERIHSGEIDGLNMKKLAGQEDIYRVRKMQFRFICIKEGSHFRVSNLSRKDDNTYNF